ncbi:MAG: hypothetical protein IKM24_01855, partial [Clostridia bacterium]|nr:hypothetical protein [Clostridia bacterium]
MLMLPMTAAAAPTDDALRYGRTVLGKMDRSEALLYVYDRLVQGCANADATITVQHDTHHITWDELGTVYRIFHSDYPEYFWVTGGYSGSYNSSTGHVVSVKPNYTVSGSELSTAKTALDTKVKELVTGLDGKSQYEKARMLHDRLAEAVTYVHTGNDQNVYGALVEGKAVCAG